MIELGLDRISKLLKLLNNPHNDFKTVHVAGTNGKGSVTLTIASVLVQAKVKIASFTSPHLLVERDCIRIDGKCVEPLIYEECRSRVLDCESTHKIQASPFEILTATAFLIFSTLSINLAIVEVGLGGKLDATNVLPPPLVAVLCKIALDHTEFLGSTIESIASHKAGILKPGTKSCVVSRQIHSETITVFKQEAATHGVNLVFSSSSRRSGEFVIVEFPKGKQLETKPSLIGDYQLENLGTACEVLCLLKADHQYSITEDNVRAGLALVHNPGRLEWIDTPKYGKLLLDGSHNADGVASLAHFVSTFRRKDEHVAFIVGFSGKKPVGTWIERLCERGDMVYPVTFSQPAGMRWISAMDSAEISKSCGPFGVDCGGSLEKALETVDRTLTKHVIVCGSLYLVADCYRLLNLSF